MRQKLNENPMAQVGIVLVLLVAVGIFLLKGSGGEEEEAATAEIPAAVAEPGVVEPAPEGVEATNASAITAPVPAPPLPKPVVSAYESGETVVLLIVRDGAIDDELAKQAVGAAESMAGTAVFVVPVHEISRYAAITLGVDVNRVPALVVMRPKRLSEAGPEASISYGPQTPGSVEQAVRDARYDGPTVSYHPE
jgi:hypothetical protein